MDVEREESKEEEEKGEVNLPLFLLPPIKPTREPTPSVVVAGV